MRVGLTKYGWPQVVVLPAVLITAMVVCPLAGITAIPFQALLLIELLLAVVLVWVLAFFRDPHRKVRPDKNLLLAPADGKVTDIETVEGDYIGGKALRIGIFLSIFDVHINRAPCNAKVDKITYRQGKYKNAMNPRSGRVNESNELGLVRTEAPNDRLIVRQVSGAIARRIVCRIERGQELAGGEKFGMIKFGSRTELYVPVRGPAQAGSDTNGGVWQPRCLVKKGDKVKAGLTALVRYEQCQD